MPLCFLCYFLLRQKKVEKKSRKFIKTLIIQHALRISKNFELTFFDAKKSNRRNMSSEVASGDLRGRAHVLVRLLLLRRLQNLQRFQFGVIQHCLQILLEFSRKIKKSVAFFSHIV